jgi:hypothetical protein
MNYKIVKLAQFSGEAANIYSVFLFDKQKTLFDLFIDENNISFISELKDIFTRLIIIGKKTGARVNYFTEFEGAPGDGICALFDTPDKKLRLYCIKYGTSIVILGGGGHKPKPVRAFQEVEKLEDENYLLREIAKAINQRIRNKEIFYTEDYQDFEGNFEFYEDEE